MVKAYMLLKVKPGYERNIVKVLKDLPARALYLVNFSLIGNFV
jgi:hypothetical protein